MAFHWMLKFAHWLVKYPQYLCQPTFSVFHKLTSVHFIIYYCASCPSTSTTTKTSSLKNKKWPQTSYFIYLLGINQFYFYEQIYLSIPDSYICVLVCVYKKYILISEYVHNSGAIKIIF